MYGRSEREKIESEEKLYKRMSGGGVPMEEESESRIRNYSLFLTGQKHSGLNVYESFQVESSVRRRDVSPTREH